MSFVAETVLSKMVKEFGDQALSVITNYVYGSTVGELVIFLAATWAIIRLALSLRDGQEPTGAVYFLFAWISCLPVGGKPAAYVAVNGIMQSVAYQLEAASQKVLKFATASEGNGMPPGYVANAVLRASAAKISDPVVAETTHAILDNCVPDPGQGLTNLQGKPLSAVDLLVPKEAPAFDFSGTYKDNFDATVRGKLAERKSGVFRPSGEEVDCFTLLDETRRGVRKNLMGQGLTAMPAANLVGAGPDVSTSYQRGLVVPGSPGVDVVNRVALNVAHGNAVRAEIMGYSFPSAAANRADISVLETVRSQGMATAAAFAIQSSGPRISRALGIEHAWENAQNLAELDQKIRNLPYFVASVQIILKVLAPLAFLSLMLGGARIAMTWCSMWTVTLLYPVIANFCRSLTNSFMLANNELSAIVSRGSPGNMGDISPAFLPNGVDLTAIDTMLQDSAKLLNSMLSMEIGIFGLLGSLLLAGSWFGGGLANKAATKVAGWALSRYGGQAAGRAVMGGGSLLAAAGSRVWGTTRSVFGYGSGASGNGGGAVAASGSALGGGLQGGSGAMRGAAASMTFTGGVSPGGVGSGTPQALSSQAGPLSGAGQRFAPAASSNFNPSANPTP